MNEDERKAFAAWLEGRPRHASRGWLALAIVCALAYLAALVAMLVMGARS